MTSEVLEDALRKGEALLMEWTRDGTVVSPQVAEANWQVDAQTLEAARMRREVFALYINGQRWYAAEALKFPLQSLALVVKALGEATPTSMLLFLLRQHGALAGTQPAQAVAAGRLDDVVRIAQEWARS